MLEAGFCIFAYSLGLSARVEGGRQEASGVTLLRLFSV